eukprot:IDg16036t1
MGYNYAQLKKSDLSKPASAAISAVNPST